MSWDPASSRDDLVYPFGMAADVRHRRASHILMRFFTVPDAKGQIGASTWIGFIVLIFIIGFGAITLVLTNPERWPTWPGHHPRRRHGPTWRRCTWPSRWAATSVLWLHLGRGFRHHPGLVAGLTLSGASAVSHDLYASVFKKGKADSVPEAKVSRMTTLALGVIAVLLGIAFEKQNIASWALAFAIAASANFPVLFLSVLWKTAPRGRVIGGFLGLCLGRWRSPWSRPRCEAAGNPGVGAVPCHLARAVLHGD